MDENRDNRHSADFEARNPPAPEGPLALAHEIHVWLSQGEEQRALAALRGTHPVDQGEVLLGLDRVSRQTLLDLLTPGEIAEILEHSDTAQIAELARDIDTASLSRILDEASPDTAADVLGQLSSLRSQETLQAMRQRDVVADLLAYPQDTAGGLMTPDFPVVREGITTANALDQLRILGTAAENNNALLVVDDDNRLVGSLSLARLALARTNALVGDLTNPHIVSVPTGQDQEECARLMERYNLTQLPVIGSDGTLSGVILAEDLVDVVTEEATEDMYRLAGVAGERPLGPLGNSLRRRLPWLYVNLATAFLAALVISIFETTISKMVALAVFLPVVAGQGGIGGTQTLTLVVRGMALGDVPSGIGLRLLTRELLLGLIHGVLLGLVVGLVAYLWKGSAIIGLALGIAMLGNMVVAGLAGAGMPLLLRRLGMDPAVSSAVFVTTFTDVIGFLLFLVLATVFLTSLG